MLLVGVKESGGWLISRWNLTYKVGWEHICKAVYSVYDFYSQPEVLTDSRPAVVHKKEEILRLGESGSMTLRGMSDIIKVPVMITIYNQTNAVEVNVARATSEFSEADYQKFNISMCQYMDSIELAMYR